MGLAILLLATLVVLPGAAVLGGTGETLQLPVDPRGAIHGVQLRLDTRWISGNGYRPIRVVIRSEPSVPSRRERTFQVTLEPVIDSPDWRARARAGTIAPEASRWSSVAATERVVLLEGATEGSTTLLLPQSSTWQGIRIRVEEEGQVLEECSAPDGVVLGPTIEEWTEVSPAVLLITRHAERWTDRTSGIRLSSEAKSEPTSTFPQVAEIAKVLSGNFLASPSMSPPNVAAPFFAELPELSMDAAEDERLTDAMIREYLRSLDRLEVLAPEDVPTRWIELSCVDLLFIDLEDARDLAARRPAQWNAIRTWVEAGQTLFVHGLDTELSQRSELEQLLGTYISRESPEGDSMAEAEPPVTGSPVARTGWASPKNSDFGNEFSDLTRLLASRMGIAVGTSSGLDELMWPRLPAPGFQLHSAGLGRVVAVTGDDPFVPRWKLLWMLNSLEPNDWSWFMRYGMSMGRDNSDVHQLQIPGVGEPPRLSYLVMITLFALAIGPLNYWALWRCRRLHLLLVTVPLAALGVTFLLMTYVVVRDGFQVRVQARSLTLLNQRESRAVTWSTQAYFAGLPPADGLRFSEATLVYPLDARHGSENYFSRNRGLNLMLDWSNGQTLRGSYLRPRETQHFQVVSAGSQPARLNIEPQANGWQVTNELGGTIHYVLIHGESGQFFRGENLDSGETRVITDRGGTDARGRIVELFQDHDTDNPSAGRRYVSGNYYTIDLGITEPRLATSVMEIWLGKIRIEPEAMLPPRSYVAFLDWPEWFEVGVTQPRRERSFHVVVGYF